MRCGWRTLLWSLALLGTLAQADTGDGGLTATAPISLQAGDTSVDLAGRSSYWLDDSGHASPDDAREHWHALPAPSAPPAVQNGQKLALHGKALWVHFVVNPMGNDDDWFLEVTVPSVDRASLYWRNNQGQWVAQHAGDAVPVAQWPLPDRYPVFQLAPDPATPTDYYLRLQNDRADFSAPLVLRSQSGLMASRERSHLLLGVYFGLSLLAVLFALFMALAQREAGYASYALYVALLAISQFSYLGLAGQFLWPDSARWNHAAFFLLPVLAACAALFFVWQVIAPAQFSRNLGLVVLGWGCGAAGLALYDAAWPSLGAFETMNFLLLGVLPLIYGMLWQGWRHGDRYVQIMAWGFVPILVGAMFPLLSNMGVLPTGFLTVYGPSIGAALEIPVLLYAITQRSAQQRETQARGQALQRTDPLTGLNNQRVLMRRLHESILRAQRSGKPCALLLVELRNHAWFGKEHGREKADAALVLAASRMRRQSHAVDTAARVGDNIFALALEGPCTAASALRTATRILSKSLPASDYLPVGAQLKLRIVVALLPDASHAADANAHTALGWLRQELAAMQSEPRKTIKSLNF